MARKVLVRLVDDIDGQPGTDVATVTFALDRVNYEIDLNEENASRLRESLAEFIAAGTRTGGRVRRGATASGRTAGGAGNAAAIREWARKQGHQLGERGRIPAEIVQAFQAATKTAAALAETAQAKARKVTKVAPGRKAAAAVTKPAGRRAVAGGRAGKTAKSTAETTAAKSVKSVKSAAAATSAKAGGKAAGATTGGTRKRATTAKGGTTRGRSGK